MENVNNMERMKNSKILIVEDNENYREQLLKLLLSEGYSVEAVEGPIEGIEKLVKKEYDLIISDLMMELMDGNRFLATAKNMQPHIRTMILTGEPSSNTEIEAINNLVDLYLEKNKSGAVILRYVERVLQKATVNYVEEQRSMDEGIRMIRRTREVFKNDELVDMTKKEFDILWHFLANKKEVINRNDFINELWEQDVENVDERVIDVHIKKIRKKMGINSIVTIRGVGYKWDE